MGVLQELKVDILVERPNGNNRDIIVFQEPAEKMEQDSGKRGFNACCLGVMHIFLIDDKNSPTTK